MITKRFRGNKSQSATIQNPVRRLSVRALEAMDLLVYSLVGFAFFLAAIFALIYSFSSVFTGFGVLLLPPHFATNVLEFVSDLLLVLIIMEVLGTVRSYLEKGDTSVQPFLFIGIISATRGILSIGARLSINANFPSQDSSGDFIHDMVELGVDAFIIIALGATLRIMGTYAINHDEEPSDIQHDAIAEQPTATEHP